MSIEVNWYDQEQRTLQWQVGKSWSVEDFYAALETTRDHASQYDGNVGVIVDARETIGRPRQNLLSHFRHALTRTDVHTVVYVRDRTGGMLIEVMVNAILRIHPAISIHEFHFANSSEEAADLIAQSLPNNTDES